MLALQDNFSFTVKDVPAGAFVKAYADYLKKNDKVVVPDVKTPSFSLHKVYIVDRIRQDWCR